MTGFPVNSTFKDMFGTWTIISGPIPTDDGFDVQDVRHPDGQIVRIAVEALAHYGVQIA